MISNVFFVLKGLMNGERGVRALPSRPDTVVDVLPDGWYFTRDDEPDPRGPYEDQQAAVEAGSVKLEDLNIEDILTALVKGQLRPMTDLERSAFLDAGPLALLGGVGPFTVLIDFSTPGEVHCEAILGEESALVDLSERTWNRA